jgi:hypothetical protein
MTLHLGVSIEIIAIEVGDVGSLYQDHFSFSGYDTLRETD